MAGELLTKAARRYLVGGSQNFQFNAAREVDMPPLARAGLYIHIPFCRILCPYCPYNRIRYEPKLVKPYIDALLAEIDLYGRRLGRIEITSIYIGGGTPTTVVGELPAVLERIRSNFRVSGPICLETTPADLDREVVARLRGCGVTMLSLGVQSFEDRFLRLLGRSYRSADLLPKLDTALDAGFQAVNLDLMFALPGQTADDLRRDLQIATATGANQLTMYPLFSFSYTGAGRRRRLKKVKMPALHRRRTMYRTINDYCQRQGFRRVSVWGFMRGDAPRYSSVTRDDYIGLGAGAASHLPGVFYFNTFAVDAYIQRCGSGRLPVAIKMELSPMISAYYWLYWRLYDTRIPKQQLAELFGSSNQKVNSLLKLLGACKMSEESGQHITLNERGAFWVHLAQNYFALNYIDKIWSIARETPFPDRIRL